MAKPKLQVWNRRSVVIVANWLRNSIVKHYAPWRFPPPYEPAQAVRQPVGQGSVDVVIGLNPTVQCSDQQGAVLPELASPGCAVRVGQEPADAGQGALGGALLARDDEDRMRTDRPQRGRDPADQEREIVRIDIDVFSQKAR